MSDYTSTFNYSICPSTFSIYDFVGGGTALYRDGGFQSFSVNKELLMRDIKQIIAGLGTFKREQRYGMKDGLYEDGFTVVRAEGYSRWILTHNNKTAIVDNGFVYHMRGFDFMNVISNLNKVLAEVIQAGQILTPRVDIVRRVADAHLLVWVYGGHSVVCYEEGVQGMCMSNCLIDGDYYPVVIVSTSREDNRVVLFTMDLEEIVEFPFDKSIEFFYKDTGDVWVKGDEEGCVV